MGPDHDLIFLNDVKHFVLVFKKHKNSRVCSMTIFSYVMEYLICRNKKIDCFFSVHFFEDCWHFCLNLFGSPLLPLLLFSKPICTLVLLLLLCDILYVGVYAVDVVEGKTETYIFPSSSFLFHREIRKTCVHNKLLRGINTTTTTTTT